MLYLCVDRCSLRAYGGSYSPAIHSLSARSVTYCTCLWALRPAYIPTTAPSSSPLPDVCVNRNVRPSLFSSSRRTIPARRRRWDTGVHPNLGHPTPNRGERMDLQLLAVGVLSGVLLAGGAISYVSHRDRGSRDSAPMAPAAPLVRESAQPVRPTQSGPPSARSSPQTATGPPPAAASQQAPAGGAQDAPAPLPGRPGPSPLQEGADAVREALHANQLAMRDPQQSTLDRVQALMTSPGFALHLADQVDRPAPEADQEKPPDSKKGPPHQAGVP